jgi:hypothetical protein
MAKLTVAGLTIAAVFFIAEIRVQRGEPPSGEAWAISTLRAIASAQRGYATVHGGYATSLKTLATPCAEGQQGFISPDFSSDPTVKGIYEIRLHADVDGPALRVDCHGNPTARAYYATAVPFKRTGTAMRALAVDQDAAIWFSATGEAPKPPFSETALRRLR